MRVLEGGVAVLPVDLVLLEQESDALGQPFDRIAALARGAMSLRSARPSSA